MQKSEIRKAEQFRIVRQRGERRVHGASSKQAMKKPPLVFFSVPAANAFAVYPEAALVFPLRDKIVARDQFSVEPAGFDAFAG